MNSPSYRHLAVGDNIPELVLPALDRVTLALYCGASGDHNPIHVDIDYARHQAGLEDVIGHGMLTMAYLGRLVTNWVRQDAIRELATRFLAPSRPGDIITCRGSVRQVVPGEEYLIHLDLLAENQAGTVLARGSAVVSV